MRDCELHFNTSVSGILDAKTLYFSHRMKRDGRWTWKCHSNLFCLGNDHFKKCLESALEF